MPRALVWGAAWDMTRDAEWSAGDYLQLALSGLPAETDIGVVQKVLLQVRTAIELYAAPEHRDDVHRSAWPRACTRRCSRPTPAATTSWPSPGP